MRLDALDVELQAVLRPKDLEGTKQEIMNLKTQFSKDLEEQIVVLTEDLQAEVQDKADKAWKNLEAITKPLGARLQICEDQISNLLENSAAPEQEISAAAGRGKPGGEKEKPRSSGAGNAGGASLESRVARLEANVKKVSGAVASAAPAGSPTANLAAVDDFGPSAAEERAEEAVGAAQEARKAATDAITKAAKLEFRLEQLDSTVRALSSGPLAAGLGLAATPAPAAGPAALDSASATSSARALPAATTAEPAQVTREMPSEFAAHAAGLEARIQRLEQRMDDQSQSQQDFLMLPPLPELSPLAEVPEFAEHVSSDGTPAEDDAEARATAIKGAAMAQQQAQILAGQLQGVQDVLGQLKTRLHMTEETRLTPLEQNFQQLQVFCNKLAASVPSSPAQGEALVQDDRVDGATAPTHITPTQALGDLHPTASGAAVANPVVAQLMVAAEQQREELMRLYDQVQGLHTALSDLSVKKPDSTRRSSSTRSPSPVPALAAVPAARGPAEVAAQGAPAAVPSAEAASTPVAADAVQAADASVQAVAQASSAAVETEPAGAAPSSSMEIAEPGQSIADEEGGTGGSAGSLEERVASIEIRLETLASAASAAAEEAAAAVEAAQAAAAARAADLDRAIQGPGVGQVLSSGKDLQQASPPFETGTGPVESATSPQVASAVEAVTQRTAKMEKKIDALGKELKQLKQTPSSKQSYAERQSPGQGIESLDAQREAVASIAARAAELEDQLDEHLDADEAEETSAGRLAVLEGKVAALGDAMDSMRQRVRETILHGSLADAGSGSAAADAGAGSAGTTMTAADKEELHAAVASAAAAQASAKEQTEALKAQTEQLASLASKLKSLEEGRLTEVGSQLQSLRDIVSAVQKKQEEPIKVPEETLREIDEKAEARLASVWKELHAHSEAAAIRADEMEKALSGRIEVCEAAAEKFKRAEAEAKAMEDKLTKQIEWLNWRISWLEWATNGEKRGFARPVDSKAVLPLPPPSTSVATAFKQPITEDCELWAREPGGNQRLRRRVGSPDAPRSRLGSAQGNLLHPPSTPGGFGFGSSSSTPDLGTLQGVGAPSGRNQGKLPHLR
eukprot:TRINITY_DN23867_c0_g2_i2.p1 TRINITY_DN23867_c0_g2~~TRINITY_DN23867_c0_g2_i2.p1  ORF type:complete len:1087 (+),score=288.93 TRINITY_DN23867_c0_g2_i2:228-3488(+)